MAQLSKVDMLAFILQLPNHTKFNLGAEIYYDNSIEFNTLTTIQTSAGRPTCNITISLAIPADPKLLKPLGIK